MIQDSAGARLLRIDKSLVPSEIGNDLILMAGVVNAERGLMNKVYRLYSPYDRLRIFGKKNANKYGSTLNELDVALNTGSPVLAVRVGQDGSYLTNVDLIFSGTDISLSQKSVVTQQNMSVFLDISEDKHFCRFVFKGEGDWNNGYKIDIKPASTKDLYMKDDHEYLAEITITPNNPSEVIEKFIVAPTNEWKNGAGISLEISSVLEQSRYIFCIVNTNPGALDLMDSVKLADPSTVTINPTHLGYSALPSPADYTKAIKLVSDFPDLYDVYLFLNFGGKILYLEFVKITNEGQSKDRALGITATIIDDGTKTVDISTFEGYRTNKYSGKYDFTCMETDWCYTFEEETGNYVATSLVSYRAKDIVANANNKQLWFAPAGYLRGNIIGTNGMCRKWNPSERRSLRDLQFNVVKSDRKGIVFWSQKTLNTLNTAYQNIHVILSFCSMSRAITEYADGYAFEFNDKETIDTLVQALQNLADQFVIGKAAEQIIVDSAENIIGSEEIKIRWNIRYKGVAEWITISVIAYPSTQDLAISMGS